MDEPTKGGVRAFGGGSIDIPSPATVLHAPPSSSLMPGPNPLDRPDPRFSRFGHSPLPHLAFAAFTSVVAWGVIRWMIQGKGGTGQGPPHRLAGIVWAVVLQAAEFNPPGTGNRVWAGIVAVIVALLAVIAWARRVGQNARHDKDQFGVLLAVCTVPLWFWLPVVLPDRAPTNLVDALLSGTRSDALLRDSFTLIFMVVLVGIGRFVLVHRIWKAGNLPFEILATLLWLPMLAAYCWLIAATCFSLVQMGDDGDLSKSRWRPTELHAQLATQTGRLSYIGIVVLLVVVSFIQHLGLARDRVDDVIFHEAMAQR